MKNELDEDAWIARHFTGDFSAEESAAFDQKLKSDIDFKNKVELYGEIWQSTTMIKVQPGLSQEARWNRLNASMGPAKIPGVKIWRYAAVFALVGAILLTYVLISVTPEAKLISTKKGETKEVILPDQSIITLNSNSELSYIAEKFTEERKIHFKGEAYFQIEKGKIPFEVICNDVQVEVLGTAFNIRTFDEKVKVDCSTGKIKVSVNGEESRILTQGLGVSIINQQLSDAYPVELNNIASWRVGKLLFDETLIQEVLAEMSRHFGVTIIEERDLNNLTFSGKFDTPKLEEMLKIICLSAGLEYELINENTVKIK